jgi:hypothetical protein
LPERVLQSRAAQLPSNPPAKKISGNRGADFLLCGKVAFVTKHSDYAEKSKEKTKRHL